MMTSFAFLYLMGQPPGELPDRVTHSLLFYHYCLCLLFLFLHDQASDEETERDDQLQEFT